ncbi:MAG: PQQ-binding-like beta-propeller repeat protein [Candidatus Sumerlaeia bacterium]|nr:PQQ-binding-like beta-propeller repeat protein [Candidatus Sumerlaeia bacterium]
MRTDCTRRIGIGILSVLIVAPMIGFSPSAAGSAPPVSTTATAHVVLFSADEIAADLWRQYLAFVQTERWKDAVLTAQALLTSTPAILIRDANDAAPFHPVKEQIERHLAAKPELADAYCAVHEGRAQALLAEFQQTRNFQALDRLLDRYPFVPFRTRALRYLADGLFDRADWVRAAAAYTRLQSDGQTTNTREMAAWACKEAASLVAAGLAEAARDKIRQAQAQFGSVVLDDRTPPLQVAEVCQRLERELGALPREPEAVFSLERLSQSAGWSFDFPAQMGHVALRQSQSLRLPCYEPVLADGTVYVTNGSELRGIEIASGRETLRWRPARPLRFNIENPLRQLDCLHPVSLRPVVAGDSILFLHPVELAQPVFSLCCVDRTSGKLLWQRAGWSEAMECIESAPALLGDLAFVVAATIERTKPQGPAIVHRRAVICFRATTGELIWRTPLPVSANRPSATPPGTIAPPCVNRSGLFVLEDRGTLYCLDPATGDLRWVQALQPSGGEGRPGNGLCLAATERVYAVCAGTPRIDCFETSSGRKVWSQEIGAPAAWLTMHNGCLILAARELQLRRPENGALLWKASAGELPLGPGCIIGRWALMPTANALHLYDLEAQRLAERLLWPERRAMIHLIGSGGDLVGMAGDTLRKFGSPGKITEMPPPALAKATAAREPADLEGEEMARALFPNIRLFAREDTTKALAAVARPLVESPALWIVHDSGTGRLLGYSAADLRNPQWRVPCPGEVVRLEFDDEYIYAVFSDRVELRSLRQNGNLLYTKAARPILAPLFEDGRILFAYARGGGAASPTVLAGYEAARRREFECPLAELGVHALVGYVWEGDRIVLLERADARSLLCLPVQIEGDRLRREATRRPPQRISFRLEDNESVSVASGPRVYLSTENEYTISCLDLFANRQVWRSSAMDSRRERRATAQLRLLGRCGRFLLWERSAVEANRTDRILGFTDLQSGERCAVVEAEQAVVFKGRLYSRSGRIVRAHNLRTGQITHEIIYPSRMGKPVWIQPVGDRLAVAFLDGEGVIRRVALQDAELSQGGVPADATGRQSRFTEIQHVAEPLYMDGWLDDWERIQPGWQEINEWRPALDAWGRAAAPAPSASDFSAKWRACVSEEGLYLAVAARDDRVVANSFSDCPGLGDSLEVALCADPSALKMANNLPTFTFSLDGVAQCWAAGPQLPANRYAVRYDPIERERVYEIHFPWSWLNKAGVMPAQTMPERSGLFFALSVNDDDGDGLKGSLEWGEGLVESWNPLQWRGLQFRLIGRGR